MYKFKTVMVKEVRRPFRSLVNYKKMQAALAEKKGVKAALMAAETLTAARKIVFGA